MLQSQPYSPDDVQTFDDLVHLMIVIYARSGEPKLSSSRRQFGRENAGKPSLSRVRFNRIVKGDITPELRDLLALLGVCGVADEQPWRDAWARCSERRIIAEANQVPRQRGKAEAPAQPTAPDPTNPVELVDQLRVHVNQLLQTAQRHAEQTIATCLGAPTAATAETAEVSRERAADLARHMCQLITNAREGIMALPTVAPGRFATADDPGVTQVLRTLASGIGSPAVLLILLSQLEPEALDRAATLHPEAFSELLRELRRPEAADWIAARHSEAWAKLLAALPTSRAAALFEHMSEEVVARALSDMPETHGASVLHELPLEVGSRTLCAMGSRPAAHLLQLLEADRAAKLLLMIRDLNLADLTTITRHMNPQNATECVRLMDQKHARRKLAFEILNGKKPTQND